MGTASSMDESNELLNLEGFNEFLTQETIPTSQKNHNMEVASHVTPEKAKGDASHKRASITNPYASEKSKKRNLISCDNDAKKPAGKKLKFEAKQTTTTVFCKNCMIEHKKNGLEKFYKCNLTECGRLIKDDFRDEDGMVPKEIPNENAFNDLQKHFHAIEYKFVYENGPNKTSADGIFKMREKAIAAGILPKDHYVDKYGSNHTMTSAVRAVAESLENRDERQFRFAFHALMYLIIFGNYCKFDPPPKGIKSK